MLRWPSASLARARRRATEAYEVAAASHAAKAQRGALRPEEVHLVATLQLEEVRRRWQLGTDALGAQARPPPPPPPPAAAAAAPVKLEAGDAVQAATVPPPPPPPPPVKVEAKAVAAGAAVAARAGEEQTVNSSPSPKAEG